MVYRFVRRLLSVALLSIVPSIALGQAYPDKPIRVVVGYAPGGLTDGVARTLAQPLSDLLKEKVYVENRPGAGGTIGSGAVAKAAPDGYTLHVVDQAFIINPSLYPSLPYDTLKEFQPITLVGEASLVMVAHPSVPVSNVKDLIALARSKPGEINYASGGSGSITHLAGELFAQVTGTKLQHIPYKGMGPATADLLGGQVTLSFSSIGPAASHIKSGKLKPLAVTGASRASALPDVPTLAEMGYASASAVGYWGVVAPAGLPASILEKVSGALTAVIKRPDVRDRLLGQGVDPIGGSPADYDRLIRVEMKKWGEIIERRGIKLQ